LAIRIFRSHSFSKEKGVRKKIKGKIKGLGLGINPELAANKLHRGARTDEKYSRNA